MKTRQIPLANWGNYPGVRSQFTEITRREEAVDYVMQTEGFIARGNGKCYGDAALSEKVLSTLGLNRILEFDADNGVVACESGVLLKDLISLIVPAGWFFHVTPGIKNITVGGAIASDVHGKNHPEKGCFSNWLISFELLTAGGDILTCSREQNSDLFWQTCGGMGWTGVILSARFSLMPVSSVFMRQKAVQAQQLEALFEAFESNRDWPYAAGWVDCLAGGNAFGRGVVYLARHEDGNPRAALAYPEKKNRNVPFYAPSWILNALSIRLHNQMLFSAAKSGEQLVDMDRYFYPLDKIRNWNRLYGRRGFIQYQFCLPEDRAFEGIRKVLLTLKKHRDLPFLSVLKRHGDNAPRAVHSFPVRGYSLALDFPRTRTVFSMVAALDEVVWDFGGKVYLTKDACSASRMGRIQPDSFGHPKFESLLRKRIREGS